MDKEIAPNIDGIELTIKGGVDEQDKLGDTYFGITRIQIDELMTKYEHRTSEEDLIYIEKLGQARGIATRLKTNFEMGIS